MATYSDYVAAIAGKTFASNFFYTVSSVSETFGGGSVGGSVNGYGPASVQGTVTVVDANAGVISIGGTNYQIHGAAGGTRDALILGPQSPGNAPPFTPPTFILQNSGTQPTGEIVYSNSRPYDTPGTTCFAAGTLIRTDHGEVPVERLAIGDLVVTASGDLQPIRWLGRRHVACAKSPWPERVMPFEIAADAFAPGAPGRTLRLSPGHAVAVAGGLVQIERLANGATVRQVAVDAIDYWHVELDTHAVLLAEGLACESFIDVGNRGQFDGERGVASLHPDFTGRTPDGYCQPLLAEGAALDLVRAQLLNRAQAMGWRRDAADIDLHLVADGARIDPMVAAGVALFRFSADAREVRLMSRSFVPEHFLGRAGDARRLGVMVTGLAFVADNGARASIDLRGAELAGFHGDEGGEGAARRWTDGAAHLSCLLWAGRSGTIQLAVTFESETETFWAEPERRAA